MDAAERDRERLRLEDTTAKLGRELARIVKEVAGPRTGFLLVMFDFGEDGNMAYCSNGVRRDVLQMLDELRAKIAASQRPD